ncbi:MAG: sulfurtransferase TusA family protein [Rhodospirillaceae bacterium]|jgi:tRNA 2-thiouridine synthesizing protein A|nr:sulfurtransferase TusA family protein [Rhodospirillaceae bacterium]MBT7956897.1 sulfurtransferase TusA family protein [Rhodospirillaceae bacterium]
MDMELDTKGMNCPMPILKAKKAMKDMAGGETITIYATDAGSVADFGAFCRTGGHELVESSEADAVFTYVIKKAS